MTKHKTHGGKRPGAGRPPKVRQPPAGPIDPEAVLHEIAGDRLQPASARVAAAKALMSAANVKPEDETASRAADVERRAIEILNRGRPN